MQRSIPFTSLILLLLMGCSNSSEPEISNELVRVNFLANSQKAVTTVFMKGEDIVFNYLFINNTEDSLFWRKPDTGPAVTWDILQDSIIVGSTNFGYGAFFVVVTGTLLPGDTMQITVSWQSNLNHGNLSVGNYQAVVDRNIGFMDIAWIATEVIDFSIKN